MIHLMQPMRLNQSHPLHFCITQAFLHISASFPSMQDLHLAMLQVAFPTEQMTEKSIKHVLVIFLQ